MADRNFDPDDFINNNFTKIGRVMFGSDNIDRKAILSFKQAFAHARCDVTDDVAREPEKYPTYISVHKAFVRSYRNYSLCLKGHSFDKVSQVFGKILHLPPEGSNNEELERE